MSSFIWDREKEFLNLLKHGVNFKTAEKVFLDPKGIIYKDFVHSSNEERFFAIGFVEEKILTVRFTYRGNQIRILGAGFWRKERKLYEKKIQERE